MNCGEDRNEQWPHQASSTVVNIIFAESALFMAAVSVLYDAKALLGESPFYDKSKEELVWVDIEGKSINFLNVKHEDKLQYSAGGQGGSSHTVRG